MSIPVAVKVAIRTPVSIFSKFVTLIVVVMSSLFLHPVKTINDMARKTRGKFNWIFIRFVFRVLEKRFYRVNFISLSKNEMSGRSKKKWIVEYKVQTKIAIQIFWRFFFLLRSDCRLLLVPQILLAPCACILQGHWKRVPGRNSLIIHIN